MSICKRSHGNGIIRRIRKVILLWQQDRGMLKETRSLIVMVEKITDF